MRTSPCLAALFVTSVALADPRSHTRSWTEIGLTVTVPAGFDELPARNPTANLLGTWRREGARADGPILLQLVHLGAIVPQRPLEARELAELRSSDPYPFVDTRERASTVRRRCFVALVNRDVLQPAAALRDVVTAAAHRVTEHARLSDDELDCLYCGAVLAANLPPGELEMALELARALRVGCLRRLASGPGGSAEGLIWPGLALEAMMLQRLGRKAELHDLARNTLPALAATPHVPARPVMASLDQALDRA